MNRPKFCVGEEVRIVSERPGAQWGKTAITAIESSYPGQYFDHYRGEPGAGGWIYKHSLQVKPTQWFHEIIIHKLPPEDRLSFEECMTSLKGVEA